MSTDWIKHKRINWPTGGLERTLALLGVKSLKEAVAKKMTQEKKTLNKQSPDYEAMKKILDEVKELLKGVDLEKLDLIERKKIALLPLNSIRDALRWKESW
jgi:hypothetical protein